MSKNRPRPVTLNPSGVAVRDTAALYDYFLRKRHGMTFSSPVATSEAKWETVFSRQNPGYVKFFGVFGTKATAQPSITIGARITINYPTPKVIYSNTLTFNPSGAIFGVGVVNTVGTSVVGIDYEYFFFDEPITLEMYIPASGPGLGLYALSEIVET